jgi:hypothetical protein
MEDGGIGFELSRNYTQFRSQTDSSKAKKQLLITFWGPATAVKNLTLLHGKLQVKVGLFSVALAANYPV